MTGTRGLEEDEEKGSRTSITPAAHNQLSQQGHLLDVNHNGYTTIRLRAKVLVHFNFGKSLLRSCEQIYGCKEFNTTFNSASTHLCLKHVGRKTGTAVIEMVASLI